MSVREAIRRVVIPPIGAGFIRTLARSMRLRVHGQEHVDAFHRRGQRVIIAFWHSQQLMMPLAYRGQEAHILISQHRDGELISQIVARFGLQSVRGSSTRGGVTALRELIRLGRSGVDLVVTPDGPKGPRHVAKLGAVQLAKATGMPIIPLAFGCSKKNSSRVGINSWFPIRSLAAHSAGALPCGSRGNLMIRRWKRCASNSKQR
ncbi:MAG TPA: lysophospholipid acyltransferase family protein [Nitrospiraceae bacterium]